MGKVVIYYAAEVSKLYTIQSLLKTVALKHTGLAVEIARQDNLANVLTPDTHLFILPGASASSVYRDQISGDKLALLQERVADGMQVLGICAGAYAFAQNFDYSFYDEQTGALIERRQVQSSLGLAPTHAIGPNLQLHQLRPYDPAARWSTYDAVALSYQTQDGRILRPALALSNGPSFSAFDASACQPLGHYTKTGEVAMLAFSYGQGGGILSGPAPEVGGRHLLQYIHPDKRHDPHLRSTLHAIETTHQDWAVMWSDLMVRLLPQRPDLHPVIAGNFVAHIRAHAPRTPKAKTPKY